MAGDGQNVNDEDILTILVATDNHLGFAEKDPIRGNDSMNTFEEILALAKENEVDFILLGGDLFHDNRPSRKCVHDCMKLMRKYCLGNKPVQVEFLSDQSDNFKFNSFPNVNYEDPNYNIAIPIFSIHGNHDDPTGMGNLSSLDLLNVTGLVNYFGKTTSLDKIEISPLLLQKGCSKLAIYGLGSVRGERLHRLFRAGQVSTLRPTEGEEDWFNLFVIHQNRVIRNIKDHVPGYYIDDYMDLIIWGHEHECRIDPEWEQWSGHKGFYISQPGSSVATQLAPGEAVKKHVGLLQIHKKNFKMTKLPLKSVRQFYLENISFAGLNLDDFDDLKNEKAVRSFLNEKVDQILENAAMDRIGNDKVPELPIVRLRLPGEYKESMKSFNLQRFGQSLMGKIANPKEMILWAPIPRKLSTKKENGEDFDKEDMQQLIENSRRDTVTVRVEDIVSQYFSKAKDNLQLSLITEAGIRTAVETYVDKADNDAIKNLVFHQIGKVQKHLAAKEMDDDEIDREIHTYREERQKNVKDEIIETRKTLEESVKKTLNNRDNDIDIISEDDLDLTPSTRARRGGRKKADDTNGATSTGKRGRGRGRGRGAAASTSRQGTLDTIVQKKPRSRAAKKNYDDDEDNLNQSRSGSRASTRRTKKSVSYFSDSDDDF